MDRPPCKSRMGTERWNRVRASFTAECVRQSTPMMLKQESHRMKFSFRSRLVAWLLGAAATCFFVSGARSAASHVTASPSVPSSQAAPSPKPDPWTTAQTVEPAALAKELSSDSKPTVVCVAPHFLYQGGHIPGASFHGPASTPQGLDDLKKWASTIPQSTNLVVYCGCCPLTHCPNLGPAFEALHAMGFSHLRVLLLRTNFYTDWASKGYATDKGD